MIILQLLNQIPVELDSLAIKGPLLVQQLAPTTNEYDVQVASYVWNSVFYIILVLAVAITTCIIVVYLPKILDKTAEYNSVKRTIRDGFMSKSEFDEKIKEQNDQLLANYNTFEKFLEYSSHLENYEVDVTICTGGNKLTIRKKEEKK